MWDIGEEIIKIVSKLSLMTMYMHSHCTIQSQRYEPQSYELKQIFGKDHHKLLNFNLQYALGHILCFTVLIAFQTYEQPRFQGVSTLRTTLLQTQHVWKQILLQGRGESLP